MSGAFDNSGTRIMIRNFNITNDHFDGLLNSLWTDDLVLIEILDFFKYDMYIAPYLP